MSGANSKLENLPGQRGLRMMTPPELQIYLQPRVTLIFDFLTPKVGRFMPLLRGPLVPVGIKIASLVFTARCYA